MAMLFQPMKFISSVCLPECLLWKKEAIQNILKNTMMLGQQKKKSNTFFHFSVDIVCIIFQHILSCKVRVKHLLKYSVCHFWFWLALKTYRGHLYLSDLFNYPISLNVSCAFKCTAPTLMPLSLFSPIINCLWDQTINPVFMHFWLAWRNVAFDRGKHQNSSTSTGEIPQREELASASFGLCAAWSSLDQTAVKQIHSCEADELTDNCITPLQ